MFNLFEDVPHCLLVNGECVLAIPGLIRWNVDGSSDKLWVCAFYRINHFAENLESILHCYVSPKAFTVSDLHGMKFCLRKNRFRVLLR